MASDDVKSINELIEKLRLREIEGTIEIIINNKGKINKVIIKKQGEIAEEIRKVKLGTPDLSDINFSNIDVSGSDFSGLNLQRSDFSYSRIENSNLAYTNLHGTNLYKTAISQTNLAHAEGIDAQNAYLTGSVNLYNVTPSTEGPITNPYGGDTSLTDEDEYALHPMDMSKVGTPKKKRNY